MPDGFETVIGLEVHCELSTATKLFCSCANAFGDEPNSNVCPVCLGLPGSLPVLNRRAVEFAMRIGLALGCEIRPSIFHRKNYFYPDMPKDYQISQYDEPINVDGHLDLPDGSRSRDRTGPHRRGHGKDDARRRERPDPRREPFRRRTTTAPACRSSRSSPPGHASAAQRCLRDELRGVLVATGASDGRMEEGSLQGRRERLGPPVGIEYGTRCEVKNLNSLRSLQGDRCTRSHVQIELGRPARKFAQETRHWDEADGSTHSLRSKEEAYDYRYFPEPDLTPVVPDAHLRRCAAEGVVRRPQHRRRRLAGAVSANAVAATRRVTAEPTRS